MKTSKTVKPDQKTLKGLVDPQFISKDPLNVLFHDLQNAFRVERGDSESDIIKHLDQRLPKLPSFSRKTPQRISLSFSSLSCDLSKIDDSDFKLRYQVIELCLDYLLRIKELTNDAKVRYNARDTLMISLHDIKIFGKLVNVIIIEGIYSALPHNIGISIEKRRLNDLKKQNSNQKNNLANLLKITRLSDDTYRFHMLSMIVNKFLDIFTDDSQACDHDSGSNNNNNDVKNLLLKGVGYSDFLISSVYLIFNPKLIKNRPAAWTNIFDEIEAFSNTYELFEIYSLIVNSPVSWFKQICLFNISHLPLKRHQSGVLALIEFITGMRHNEDISIEKLNHINRILLSKPTDISTVDYFENLSRQMYNLLILINRPIITSVAANFIETLYKKNARIVNDFYFSKIWNTVSPQVLTSGKANKSEPRVEGEVLVTGKDFKNVINVIYSLIKNVLDNSLVNALLLKDLIISLWNYLLFIRSKKLSESLILNEIIGLVLNPNNLDFSLHIIMLIFDNLLTGLANYPFVFALLYEEDKQTLVNIKQKDNPVISQEIGIIYQSYGFKELHISSKEAMFNHVNDSTDLLIEVIERIEDNEHLIRKLFIEIMKKWLANDYEERKVKTDLLTADNENSLTFQLRILASLKLLQSMSLKFKDVLSSNENVLELLEIINTILMNIMSDNNNSNNNNNHNNDNSVDDDDDDKDSDDEDSDTLEDSEDTLLSLCLDILISIILEKAESSFMLIDDEVIDKLSNIESKLVEVSKENRASKLDSISTSLQNEIIKIKRINDKFSQSESCVSSDNNELSNRELAMKLNKAQKKYEDDIKIYKKALQNIESKSAPMKAFGLQSINDSLIKKKSKIVSLREFIHIYLSQLSNAEPFLYLVAIKGLSNILEYNLDDALPILLDIFTDKKGKAQDNSTDSSEGYGVDTRLKIGEVLHNLVSKYNSDPLYGEGKHASALFPLSKTQELVGEMINMVRVVPKTGGVDVDNAVRMSSISIIESCFRANLNGIIQFLQDTLDIVIGILTFETGSEKDVISMRRGAIKLVHGVLVGSAIHLREVPRGYGKLILQRLAYTKDLDVDILVKEQAGQTIQEIQSVFQDSLIE